jgi:predicted ArsR family transcriptional regulator
VTENNSSADREVFRFIFERIESVPHLEALLLIWNSRPGRWSVNDLAQRLYVDRKVARGLLEDLARHGLIVTDSTDPQQYFYRSESAETDALVSAVHAKYRVEIVNVSTMIHRKASSAVRDFADAFRFKKESE